ncbi:hypothetical protein OPT61_g5892 [Boeremia exigua]|uniref:Uncharacterized protein n=1 Tax=Boeremia exigua TaxID=749465 RepID=A0ACC2I8P6_9PLEO|nr:hypothetical protein OPT61_g5892 [Boeremia exigua]
MPESTRRPELESTNRIQQLMIQRPGVPIGKAAVLSYVTMKTTGILSFAMTASMVFAMPAEPVPQLEKRIGNCGQKCPADKKAIVLSKYSDIKGNMYGDTVAIMNPGIDYSIAWKTTPTSDVCGKYNNGYTIHCNGKTVASIDTPAGNNWKCQSFTANTCSATTGISTTNYQIFACC